MKTILKAALVTLIVAMSCSSPARSQTAFNLMGFTQGMTKAQASAFAATKGLALEPVNGTDSAKQTYFDVRTPGLRVMLGFCWDTLFWASYVVSKGFVEFGKAIDSAKVQNSMVQLDASTRYFVGYDGEDHVSVNVVLGRDGLSFVLHYTLFGKGTYGATNYQVTYKDPKVSALCEV